MVFFSEFVKLWSHLRIATTHGTDRLYAGDVVGCTKIRRMFPGRGGNYSDFGMMGYVKGISLKIVFISGSPGLY